MSDNQTLLCDIGGTHARFARLSEIGAYDNFKKYKLNEFDAFEDIIRNYLDDSGLTFTAARFAAAREAVNGVIAYKRSIYDPDYEINFPALQKNFQWNECRHLLDLEAGGMGLRALHANQSKTVIPNTKAPLNDNPVLISVGTGIAHALVSSQSVSRSTDGHFLPITVTDEHRKVEAYIRKRKDKNLSLIMEDFVSGRGLRMITTSVSGVNCEGMNNDDFVKHLHMNPDAVRLFFEFLGLYAHNVITVSGHYGGLFLTGGVIDRLVENNLTDWDAFHACFNPSMLPVVKDRLSSVAIHYLLHDELPLLGLTTL